MKIIGLIPDCSWTDIWMEGFSSDRKKNDGKGRGALKETWVTVCGIEIPCIYLLYEAKVHKSSVCNNTKQCERNLIF